MSALRKTDNWREEQQQQKRIRGLEEHDLWQKPERTGLVKSGRKDFVGHSNPNKLLLHRKNLSSTQRINICDRIKLKRNKTKQNKQTKRTWTVVWTLGKDF